MAKGSGGGGGGAGGGSRRNRPLPGISDAEAQKMGEQQLRDRYDQIFESMPQGFKDSAQKYVEKGYEIAYLQSLRPAVSNAVNAPRATSETEAQFATRQAVVRESLQRIDRRISDLKFERERTQDFYTNRADPRYNYIGVLTRYEQRANYAWARVPVDSIPRVGPYGRRSTAAQKEYDRVLKKAPPSPQPDRYVRQIANLKISDLPSVLDAAARGGNALRAVANQIEARGN